MTEKNPPLVGIFDEHAKADRVIEQLLSAGIPDDRIHQAYKTGGPDIAHVFSGGTGLPEEMKPDFTGMGFPSEEARYYEDEYEAGYTLVFVHPGNHREQAMSILQRNGTYNYRAQPGTPQTYESTHSEETGAMTPGMRGDDSSQTGIATTAGGTEAANVDPTILEADLQHAQQVLEEKYKAREEESEKRS